MPNAGPELLPKAGADAGGSQLQAQRSAGYGEQSLARCLPHRGGLAQKLRQEAIKLGGALEEHMVVAPFVRLENLQPGPGDVLVDPDLRLPRHETHPAPHNEGGQSNPGMTSRQSWVARWARSVAA